MSDADREKWDARYAAGAYSGRDYPSDYLVARTVDIERGPALDLACGAGRNACYLAASGFTVDAIDISAVGLEHARARAAQADLTVHWLEQDLLLESDLPRSDYQLIILFRFVAPQLLASLPLHLRPGGYLIVEEHLKTDADVAGPSSDRFRVGSGELIDCLPSLTVVDHFEGLVTDPDGAACAVARLTAQMPF